MSVFCEKGEVRTYVGQSGLPRRGKNIKRWSTFTVIGRNRLGYICRAHVGKFEFGLGDAAMANVTLPGVHLPPPLPECKTENCTAVVASTRHKFCEKCSEARKKEQNRNRFKRRAGAEKKRIARAKADQGGRGNEKAELVGPPFEIPHIELVREFVSGRGVTPSPRVPYY